MALRKQVLISSNRAVLLSTSRGQHDMSVKKVLWTEQPWKPREEQHGCKNEQKLGWKRAQGYGLHPHFTNALCGLQLRLGLSVHDAETGPLVSQPVLGSGVREGTTGI